MQVFTQYSGPDPDSGSGLVPNASPDPVNVNKPLEPQNMDNNSCNYCNPNPMSVREEDLPGDTRAPLRAEQTKAIFHTYD